MIKNSVKNAYEWKHCKIQNLFQKEGEDYDNNLSSKPDTRLVVSMDWNLHVKDCSSQ